nr:hypothetical protein [uncultured Christensenella sp.]
MKDQDSNAGCMLRQQKNFNKYFVSFFCDYAITKINKQFEQRNRGMKNGAQ